MCEYLFPDFSSNKIGCLWHYGRNVCGCSLIVSFLITFQSSAYQNHFYHVFRQLYEEMMCWCILFSNTRITWTHVHSVLYVTFLNPDVSSPWLGSCFNGPLTTFRVSKFSFHQIKNPCATKCYYLLLSTCFSQKYAEIGIVQFYIPDDLVPYRELSSLSS